MDHISIQDASFYHLEALQVVHHLWNYLNSLHHTTGHLDLFCSSKDCVTVVTTRIALLFDGARMHFIEKFGKY